MELRPPTLSRNVWLIMVASFLMIVLTGVVWWLMQPAPGTVNQADYAPFASLAESQAFYKAHPLLRKTAPTSEPFNYKGSVTEAKQPFYQIYLVAPAIKADNPPTREEYRQTLLALQKKATDWFSKNGEDLSKAYVQWSPDPATYGPTPTQPPIPQTGN